MVAQFEKLLYAVDIGKCLSYCTIPENNCQKDTDAQKGIGAMTPRETPLSTEYTPSWKSPLDNISHQKRTFRTKPFPADVTNRR